MAENVVNGVPRRNSNNGLSSVSEKSKNMSIKDTALVEEGDSRRVS